MSSRASHVHNLIRIDKKLLAYSLKKTVSQKTQSDSETLSGTRKGLRKGLREFETFAKIPFRFPRPRKLSGFLEYRFQYPYGILQNPFLDVENQIVFSETVRVFSKTNIARKNESVSEWVCENTFLVSETIKGKPFRFSGILNAEKVCWKTTIGFRVFSFAKGFDNFITLHNIPPNVSDQNLKCFRRTVKCSNSG